MVLVVSMTFFSVCFAQFLKIDQAEVDMTMHACMYIAKTERSHFPLTARSHFPLMPHTHTYAHLQFVNNGSNDQCDVIPGRDHNIVLTCLSFSSFLKYSGTSSSFDPGVFLPLPSPFSPVASPSSLLMSWSKGKQ